MKVVIRADASLQIGTGHVMRCLTLAEALKQKGAEVSFICREHSGNLISFIGGKGFNVFSLGLPDKEIDNVQEQASQLFHSEWLGASQKKDSQQCREILEQIEPDWLIIDHYAIDQAWQTSLKDLYSKLMVIDDLADRLHKCDVLLDQTFGRVKEDYQSLVPAHCQLLLGSQYALLRPEFSQWREYSLKRRVQPEFKSLLITMGGVDAENVTGQVLEVLKTCDLPDDLKIKVIMGSTAPNLRQVKEVAELMPYTTEVMMGVANMAELMTNADFAIGAAGATTWERCALGLPAIHVVLAENQKDIAFTLVKQGVAEAVEKNNLQKDLPEILVSSLPKIGLLSKNAALIVDGHGCQQVAEALWELTHG